MVMGEANIACCLSYGESRFKYRTQMQMDDIREGKLAEGARRWGTRAVNKSKEGQ